VCYVKAKKGGLIELGNCGMIAGAFSSTSGKADITLTTNGDVLYYNSGRQRLAIGSEGTVLTVSGSDLPAWEATGGLSSPLTSDLVYNDSVKAAFGTGGSDSSIYHDGTNMYLACSTGRLINNSNVSMASSKCLTVNTGTATIASGSITGNANVMTVDTEGSASSDDLDEALYNGAAQTGAMFGIVPADNSRTIVIKANVAGGVQFLMSGDFTMDSSSDFAFFSATANTTHNYGCAVSNNAS